VHDGYLKVLRERLQNALRSDDAPPLLLAEIEADLFGEQIEKLKSQMFDETLQDWLNGLISPSRLACDQNLKRS